MKSVLAAAAAFLFLAAPASGAETITLNEANPALGDFVTFTVTGVPTHQIKNPRISVDCYQGGVSVFGMAGGIHDAFDLGGSSSDWQRNGGPADCVATLYYFDKHGPAQEYVVLASSDFAAGG